MKEYDEFFPNMLEMTGKIERKPFKFLADNCKIWYQGKCIEDINSSFKIDSLINTFDNSILLVSIDNSRISDYISDSIIFSEISLLNDRVLWSNNILNDGEGEEYKNMSLFYCSGILSRIYINRSNPLIMLEFNSNQQGHIKETVNPLKWIIEKIRISKEKKEIDLSNFNFTSNSHQRYENGTPIRGLQTDCQRTIIIKENTNGCEGYLINSGEGYIVSIINDSESSLLSGNKTMTAKPMKIISQTQDKIVLRGYKCKAQSPFGFIDFDGDDYGITISLKNNQVDNCTLQLYDRNVDITYFK